MAVRLILPAAMEAVVSIVNGNVITQSKVPLPPLVTDIVVVDIVGFGHDAETLGLPAVKPIPALPVIAVPFNILVKMWVSVLHFATDHTILPLKILTPALGSKLKFAGMALPLESSMVMVDVAQLGAAAVACCGGKNPTMIQHTRARAGPGPRRKPLDLGTRTGKRKKSDGIAFMK
jgi:hypothetical protein